MTRKELKGNFSRVAQIRNINTLRTILYNSGAESNTTYFCLIQADDSCDSFIQNSAKDRRDKAIFLTSLSIAKDENKAADVAS